MREEFFKILSDDELYREIMNGTWFILSLEILFALIIYLFVRLRNSKELVVYEWTKPASWYQDPATQLAIAWTCYMAGSAVRAGWIWLLLECQNRLGRNGCYHISNSQETLWVATILAVIGGVCTIRCMLRPEWRPWSYLVPGVVAVTVPLVVHYFLRFSSL